MHTPNTVYLLSWTRRWSHSALLSVVNALPISTSLARIRGPRLLSRSCRPLIQKHHERALQNVTRLLLPQRIACAIVYSLIAHDSYKRTLHQAAHFWNRSAPKILLLRLERESRELVAHVREQNRADRISELRLVLAANGHFYIVRTLLRPHLTFDSGNRCTNRPHQSHDATRGIHDQLVHLRALRALLVRLAPLLLLPRILDSLISISNVALPDGLRTLLYQLAYFEHLLDQLNQRVDPLLILRFLGHRHIRV